MTVIEQRFMELVPSHLSRISDALERIADALERTSVEKRDEAEYAWVADGRHPENLLTRPKDGHD